MALSASAPEGWQMHAPPHDDLDISDPALIRQALHEIAPSLVINAAAYSAVDRTEEKEDAFRANGRGVAHLIKACPSQDIALVHFSTDFVFHGAQSTPYTSDDETAPLGVYDRSKLAGEQAAL